MIEDMTPREMYKMLKDAKADIMLSGGRSQFIALKATMPWLDINQERHHAYMGYVGMVKLVKEIDKTLYNPVWEQVRKPAPWAKAGESWQDKALAQIAEEEAELAADPVKAEEVRRAKAVCMCKSVALGAIEDAIRDLRPHQRRGRARKDQRLGRLRRLRLAHRGNSRRGRHCRAAGGGPDRGGGVSRMAKVVHSKKACSVNPLKMSQPIGGGAGLHGPARRHAAAARLAGLHLLRPGAVRAPFQGSHSAADHRDERSRDGARRL